MTLLFSCLTPQYIVHVSDRRLTWPDGRVAEETANKAILFHNIAVFSYTGISRVGSMRTDEWITERLIGRTGIQDAITSLTSALDSTVARLPWPDRRLAVVVDCWAATQDSPVMRPWSCAITNFCDPASRQIVPVALPRFSTFTQSLPEGKGYAFIPLGQTVDASTMKRLTRQVVRAMRHASPTPTTITPESVSRFMRDAVLEVAAGNTLVGRNLMVATVRNRDCPENDGLPNSFGYFAEGSGDPTFYAPIVVTPELAIKGFKAYPGPPRFKVTGGEAP